MWALGNTQVIAEIQYMSNILEIVTKGKQEALNYGNTWEANRQL